MQEESSKYLFEKYLAYAVQLLAAREYSRKLLQEKIEKKFLKKKELEDTDFLETNKRIILSVLDFLTEKNYLDEQRTAENFLRYRREFSPQGKRMISQDMYRKKLDPEISAQVLAGFSEEEEQKDCIFLAKKKWNMLSLILIKQFSKNIDISNNDENSEEIKKLTLKLKDKLFRFLAGKGFPCFMIQNSWEEIKDSKFY